MGIVYIIISSILYGVFNPLIKKAGLNPYATLTLQLGISWLVGLPLFLATNSQQGISTNSVVLIAIASTIATAGYILAIKAFPLLPLWQVALFTMITPVATSIFSYFILGETLTPKFFLSLLFITIGLIIAAV